MRSLKELYGMVYEHIKDMSYISGLCFKIRCTGLNTDMSEKEIEMLLNHFKSQRYLHPEFQTKERNWSIRENGFVSDWWWTCKEDHNPVNRIALIKKLMETAE